MSQYDLATDLGASALILEKVQRQSYAQNLYAALCNMQWQKSEVWPVLKDELWSCTWRSAGGIVAELQGQGDYLSWYCSGIYNDDGDVSGIEISGYVPESVVTDEIREDLRQLGWHPVPYIDDN